MSKILTTSLSLSGAASQRRIAGSDGPFRVSFLIVPRFNLAEMVSMIEPMRVANYLSPRPLYEWEILSFDGPEITASNGLSITANRPGERSRRDEIIFIFASWGAETYENREATSWIRRQAREGARICAVELGCYLVARAGLLKGRKVATHWSCAPGFQERFPETHMVDQIYTPGDHVMTCAGGFAGVDMMLRLITDQHGEGLASEVADQLLYHPVRPPTAPQRRMMGHGLENLAPVVRDAITLMENHIEEPLNVPQIAEEMGVSQRQLERQFKASVGCTVVQFGLLLRLQHARVLLVATGLPVRDIAAAAGFNTLSHFAHAFRKCFGRRPSDYRQAWPKEDAAPTWPGTLTKYLETLETRTAARSVKGGGGRGMAAAIAAPPGSHSEPQRSRGRAAPPYR
ncbi:GlxA family transcriptional regulator [Pseudogemmobacter humi]|uniref:HTH-type transcriptional regulator CdhR n=1 Tax=Pseudogemmobacter humi TaxID=2483812 RepID=A0A3P5WTE4_9RHOB|nr:GlxA family transcriptional regulator [Pseudogemmobacter humi]VDC24915.1 HTH-type transcriptional regulator CdhR [Pseudogemmobacter humi]